MRIKNLLFTAVFGILLLASCSNDFEIAAPWQEIPIVYGIVSPADTAHYVRIEKAFLDPNENAYVVAQIADSLYYPASSIAVFLEHKSTGQRYPMTRVDGNLEGYPRKPGTFATTPNWLYKVKNGAIPGGLKGGNAYRLVVERTDGKPAITGETTIPDTLFLVTPNPANNPPILSFESQSTGPIPQAMSWRASPEAALFNVTWVIRYREVRADGTELPSKSFRWRPVTNLRQGKTVVSNGLIKTDAEVSHTAFYKVLADSIPTTTELKRYFNGINIEFEGGGAEVLEYLDTQASSSGLTGAEVVNVYSNMSEGFGIFSSKRTWRYTGFRINSLTIQAMEDNPLTSGLNFKG